MKPERIVLFQGDSITDGGRLNDTEGLGFGYAKMAASMYHARHPESQVTFLNRGISGNTVVDLTNRWESDCLLLRPNLVSIMIGINDCAGRFNDNNPMAVEVFEGHYRNLLKDLQVVDATVILMEPFVLPYPEDRILWRQDLDQKINVVRNLAREFGASLLSTDGLLQQASVYKPPIFWAADGVHPSGAGHALIAEAWLKIAEKLL